MDYTTNAPNGAALLDEKRPGWWQDIDTEALTMGSFQNCIIGQLYVVSDDPGDIWELQAQYLGALAKLGADEVANGFNVDYGKPSPLSDAGIGRFDILGREWQTLIHERLAADPISAPLA